VHDDQGAALAVGDQIGSKYGFSKARWSHDNAIVIFEYGFCGLLLCVAQFTGEVDLNDVPRVSQILDFKFTVIFLQQIPNIANTPSWQADVISFVLDSGDDASFLVR
jgi:hypothetical protein